MPQMREGSPSTVAGAPSRSGGSSATPRCTPGRGATGGGAPGWHARRLRKTAQQRRHEPAQRMGACNPPWLPAPQAAGPAGGVGGAGASRWRRVRRPGLTSLPTMASMMQCTSVTRSRRSSGDRTMSSCLPASAAAGARRRQDGRRSGGGSRPAQASAAGWCWPWRRGLHATGAGGEGAGRRAGWRTNFEKVKEVGHRGQQDGAADADRLGQLPLVLLHRSRGGGGGRCGKAHAPVSGVAVGGRCGEAQGGHAMLSLQPACGAGAARHGRHDSAAQRAAAAVTLVQVG